MATFIFIAFMAFCAFCWVVWTRQGLRRSDATQAALEDLRARLKDPCCPVFAEQGTEPSAFAVLRHRWAEPHSPDCSRARQVDIIRRS